MDFRVEILFAKERGRKWFPKVRLHFYARGQVAVLCIWKKERPELRFSTAYQRHKELRNFTSWTEYQELSCKVLCWPASSLEPLEFTRADRGS
jgi:hypothetical protein